MSHNNQVKKFKNKYEKDHARAITGEEAEFLYYKKWQKMEVSICLAIAIIAIVIMACVQIFSEPTETPLPYIFGTGIAIIFIFPLLNYNRKIKRYQDMRKKPESKILLSRKLLADNPNSLSYSKSDIRVVIILCILTVAFGALGIIYMNTEERWWAFGPALGCLILSLLFVVGMSVQRNKRKRIHAGDFMLFSARLVDVNAEFGMEENSREYGRFSYDMPLGEGYDRLAPTHGYYPLTNVRPDDAVIGMRYYLVLLRTKKVNENGEHIYELYDMLSEDFYKLDDELRKLVIMKS